MYGLAAAGSQLELELRRTFGNDIDDWGRIHLLPFTNEFLPVEHVYAGSPPEVGAPVCENATEALRAGSCGECPNRDSTAFVCPLHFWGFHKLIERSSRSKVEDAAKRKGRPCVPSRDTYPAVSSLLFAASNRAFNYATDDQARMAERTGLVNALNVLWKPILEAEDWKQWRTEAEKQPNLLVLVVHADKYATSPVLEIGKGKFLGKNEIRPGVLGADRPLVLILLGCSVAGVEDDFQSYPALFHDAGAKIVLATIASIRGIDAVLIAKRLSALFAQGLANREPTPFGELLPLLRRQLLSEGYPGAIGLVGFGDGDWLLGGR
jgi:hypothetical protein